MTTTVAGKPGKLIMSARQRALWPVLIVAAFFEGFDDALINIALPYIKRDFGISDNAAGVMLSIVAAGTIVAFFASRLADSFGRRRVFLWSVYGYAVTSLLTAVAWTLPVFVGLQFVARIFLIGCWSTGYVIVCEEFANEHRGTAVGRFQLTAVFGGLLIGILLPVVASAGVGWRALYVVGALPLIPVVLLRRRLPETPKYVQLTELRQAGIQLPKESFFAAWKRPYIKYMVVMCLVWFFLYFGVKGSLNFFALRVDNELGWTETWISIAILTSTVAGIFIIALNGQLLDRLGRKRAAVIIIAVGAGFSALTFWVTNTYLILAFNIISVGCLNSFLIIGSTLTNELFPTQIRGNAMGWTNNIAGRLGQIAVPIFGTGVLPFSLGHSVALTMLLPLISLVLIVVFLPETRGRATPDDVPEEPDFLVSVGAQPLGSDTNGSNWTNGV